MEHSYDKQQDALSLQLRRKPYWKSLELSNTIVIDISINGEIIAIEILDASRVFTGDARKVIESLLSSGKKK